MHRHAGPVIRLLLTLSLIIFLNDPGWAEPSEDPRDQQIRDLQSKVETQSQQIETLRKSMEELKGMIQAPPVASPGETTSTTPDNSSNTTIPVVEESGEEADPGPEPPPPLEAGSNPPASSASGQQPSMNPNISVIGLLEGRAGGAEYDPTKDSFYLREIEVALQAPIDPYARADIYLTFPHDESPGVEEATLTWTGLPGGFQAKGGLLKADFGRINQLHTHALPQIDSPLVNQAVFGPESLHDPGVELSWLAPTPWYSRFSVQAMTRSQGPAADDATALDLTNPLSGEQIVEVLSARDDFTIFPTNGSKNLLYVGRWENLWDLSESTTLQLGMSGATSEIGAVELQNSSAYGADLTLKWRPLDNANRSLTWQTEFIRAHQSYAGNSRNFGGWYSFANYQMNRNWSAGLRYGQTGLPFDPRLEQRRATALLEWIPSEFNRLRFQYNHNTSNYQPSFNEFLVQWNIVLGPHGAHKY